MIPVGVEKRAHPLITMSTSRIFLNNKRISTGRTLSDNKFLQVYPLPLKTFDSEADWRTHWTSAINDSITFKKQDAPVPSKQTGTNWICGYCRLPPGNDHRMCIVRGFNSVEGWYEGRIWLSPTPAPAPSPASEPEPDATAAKVVPKYPASSKRPLKEKKNGRAIDWTFSPNVLDVTAPPGKYYIGDLCYSLFESTYDEVFGGTMYNSGLYECEDGFFLVDGTAYGDGAYKGSDRKEYLVDAGIIGIASWKVVDKNNASLDGGHIHEFKDPVRIRFGRGKFEFTSSRKHLTIDTAGDDDDSDDSDDSYNGKYYA